MMQWEQAIQLKVSTKYMFTISIELVIAIAYMLLFVISAITDDPYDPNEKDLAKCRALESSLWELKVALVSIATNSYIYL